MARSWASWKLHHLQRLATPNANSQKSRPNLWPIRFSLKHLSVRHMMKSINISTKFTVLILAVSLVAVAAISFFSYDYHLKANQEKFATNLAVIADNQTAYFNSYFERAERTVQFLQNSDKIRSGLAGGESSSGGGVDLLMAPIGQETTSPSDSSGGSQGLSLSEYLNEIKSTLQVSEITITSP